MALALKNASPVRNLILAVMLVLTFLTTSIVPAFAETTGQRSTRNIILGAVALTAGIILYNNYQQKRAYANSIVGYTRDGGVIYGDGRIVYPNGVVVYTSNNGRSACTFDGYGTPCRNTNLYGYFPQGYRPGCWPPGHCKQYYKHHREHGDENNNNDDQGDGG